MFCSTNALLKPEGKAKPARLQDDARKLKDYGVLPNKPILVLGAATSSQQQAALGTQEHQAAEQQSREQRLTRLRNAAKALAQRSGSRYITCLLHVRGIPPQPL